DVLANTLEITVVPHLEREGGSLPATLFHGALVHAARGVGVNAVGRTECDINVAAVGLPAGLAGGKVVVGVLDAPVMLLAKFVLRRIGIGVAAQPEVLDECLALFIVGQAHEGLALIVANNVGDVLIQPNFVGPLQFLPQSLLRLVPLLIAELALHGIDWLALT